MVPSTPHLATPPSLSCSRSRAAAIYPGPALVDLVTDPNALSMPPAHVSAAQVRGFALAATKVVLSGGVGRMLEMARSNLRNIPGAALGR